VRVWDDKDSLSGTCDWCSGHIGAPSEDPSDLRLAHTQINYRATGVLRIMQLLQALCERISQLVAPLTDLTKKGAFRWSKEA
jgi:hypothetical protein